MIELNLNGATRHLDIDPDMPLLWAIREHAGLTGTKYGCGIGQCGACTVHLDGVPVRACSIPVAAAAGKLVVTIEGLDSTEGRALKAAWERLDVVQCGFCQPGQIMSAAALLGKVRDPSDADIDRTLSGNLCRCATYERIREAVKLAARTLA
jgi:isoquinoline 1-oxidoreductase alpha subunit